MLPNLLKALLVLAFLAATPALAEPEESEFNPAERQAMQQGKLVVRLRNTSASTLKDVVVAGYVEAMPQDVWNVITDYPNYPKIWPRILKSEVRNRQGLLEDHHTVVNYPWPFPNASVVTRIEHAADQRSIRWHRLDGSMKEFAGSWQLFPEGAGTLLIYKTRVDPGIPLIPHWAIDWANAQVAPDIIEGVRRHLKARRQVGN